jgi:hypothetical protein
MSSRNNLFAASRRMRNQTTLGQLEQLLKKRRIARRQLTCAQTRVANLDDAIADLAHDLATQSFEAELARFSGNKPSIDSSDEEA